MDEAERNTQCSYRIGKIPMTYKLDPIVEKIEAPVAVITPYEERIEFESGVKAYTTVYDKPVVIKRITTEKDWIVIELVETSTQADSALFDGA